MGFFDKKRLLNWQNALLSKPEKRLIMTEKQLINQTSVRCENNLRILTDSQKLLENTVKPDVFFERLRLAEEKMKDLVRFEAYIRFSGTKPSFLLHTFYSEMQEVIGNFLVRYFTSVFDKAEKLKTDKAKLNQYQKFYDSLQEYYVFMDESNIEYIETRYRAYTQSYSNDKG